MYMSLISIFFYTYLAGMDQKDISGKGIVSLQHIAAHALYTELSAPDAVERYSVREVSDLVDQLKHYCVWDLVAQYIPKDNSGELLYWKVTPTQRVPSVTARSARVGLYRAEGTEEIVSRRGDEWRVLEGVCAKDLASWIISDDGACAVGKGLYLGKERLLYGELVTGGVYPLAVPDTENRIVVAFIPQTHVLVGMGKSGIYCAPIHALFQQGAVAWQKICGSYAPSAERIVSLSQTLLYGATPREIFFVDRFQKTVYSCWQAPDLSTIEQVVGAAKTEMVYLLIRRALRANRSSPTSLVALSKKGAVWQNELDALFPASFALSPDEQCIGVITKQGDLAIYTAANGDIFTSIVELGAHRMVWSAYYFCTHGFRGGTELHPSCAHYAAYALSKRIKPQKRAARNPISARRF